MFAVIKTGGKQYRVGADDTLTIERIEGEEGSRVEFAQVLMVGEGADVTIGTPAVDGARVTAEVIEQGRGPKTISFKKRRRQNSRRKKGHRQLLTTVSILEILTAGATPTRDGSGRSAEDRRRERDAAYVATLAGVTGGVTSDDATSVDSSNVEAQSSAAALSTPAPIISSEDDAASDRAEEEAAADAAAAAAPARPARPATPEPEEATRDADEAGGDEGAGSTAETLKEAAEGAAVGAAVGAVAGAAVVAGAALVGEDRPDGPLFEAPAGEPDKLTKLKGVGPVAERQLNEQGITTFAQIAGLSEEDIERIDAYMPFSAAQIRTWQEQARSLG